MVGFTRRTVVLLAALALTSCAVDRAGRRRSALGALSPPIRPTARLYPPETAETRRIRAALEKPVSVDFQATPFDKVMDTFADLAGVNVVVDQQALVVEGVGPDTAIKLKVKNIPLASALSLALEQMNLDYFIWHEVLFVTNVMGSDRELETQVYDVRDLVAWLEDRPAPKANGGRGDQVPHGRRVRAHGGGNGLPAVSNGWGEEESWGTWNPEEDSTPPRPIDQIAGLIQTLVAPQSWAAGFASIQAFRDQALIIKNAPRDHAEIEVVLTRLRELIARQAVASDSKRVHQMDLRPWEAPWVKRLREQLGKPVSVEFADTRLEEAIDFLRNAADLNIVLDFKALVMEGISPDTTLKLRVENIPAEQVLNLILRQVNLDYVFRHGVIYVTNGPGIGYELWVRVYGVHDIVAADEGEDASATREHADELADFVEQVIAPSTWASRHAAGQAAIEVFGGEILVIAQTPRCHDQIFRLFNTLCEALSPAERSAMREGLRGPGFEPPSPKEERIRRELAKPVTTDFAGTPFDPVMEYLRDLTGANFVVDEVARREEKIGPESLIRLKVSNVSLASALDLILQQVNLQFVVTHEGIFITDIEGANRDLEVRLYDVGDLVQRPVKHRSRPRIEDRSDTTTERATDRVLGGWGVGEEETDTLANVPAPLRDLATLIIREIGPDSWKQYPWMPSFRNRIIAVTAPALAQERIAALLTRLRAWLAE